ncbi:MAG: rod shape-determining protein MreD [Thermodesulfovibrionales bacterium]
MRYLLWIAATFCCFLLQGKLSVLGVAPNLTILPVYYAGLRHGETRGLMAGILVGYIEDNLSYSLIGPHLMSDAIIGYMSAFLVSGALFRWTPLLGIIAVATLTVADNVIVFASKSIFDKAPALFSTVVYTSVMQALINAPAGIFLGSKNAD